jgi:hypothetical protein
MTIYVTLAISDTMFPHGCVAKKKTVSANYVKNFLRAAEGVVSGLNPSHESTIETIKRRFDVDLPIPVKVTGQVAPKILLQAGDQLIVAQAQLPRLAEGSRFHSQEVVDQAMISFSFWSVKNE